MEPARPVDGAARSSLLHSSTVKDRSGHATPIGRFGGSDRPQGFDDVETAVFDGEIVLFHESARMVHRLNATAGSVWLLCDGQTSVDSMAVELGEVFDMRPDDLLEGIYQALDQIAGAGLLVGISPTHHHPRHHERPELVATDGSRMLIAPPDP